MAIADQWEMWFPDAYEVGSESVRLFARATRNEHVPYSASRVLPKDCPVPPTLLAAPLMQGASAAVAKAIPGCNLAAIMHAGQTFHYLKPVHIGDVICVGTKLGSHVLKAEVDMIVVNCTAYVEDEPALTSEIFIIHSRRETGIDQDAANALADEIMMTGTGPSRSDEYAAKAGIILQP